MATTTNSPVATIPQGNTMGALVDVSKYLAGTAQGGSQTTKGQTAPLEAILAQIMAPGNLEALVANLFSQGAAQVPGLTAQYANATGTRTSNNSMLSQSLAELNSSLSQAIANAVVQQQQVAAGAASNLGNINKSTTQQQKTEPGNLMKALIPSIGGFALNRAGKFMDANKTASGMDANAAPAPAFTDFQAQAFEVPELGLVNPGADGGLADFASFSDAGGSVASGFDEAGFSDYSSSAADLASAWDTAEAVGQSSEVADIFGGMEDFNWFRDGGQVRKRQGYADGGQIRNRPNFGPAPVVQRTPAMNFRQGAPAPVRRRGRTVDEFGNAVDAPGSETAPTNAVGSPGNVAAVANAMTPSGIMSVMGMLGLVNAPLSVIAQHVAEKAIVKSIVQTLFSHQAPPTISPQDVVTPTAMPPAISVDEEGNPVTTMPAPPDVMSVLGFPALTEQEQAFTQALEETDTSIGLAATGGEDAAGSTQGFDEAGFMGFDDGGDGGADGGTGTSGGGVSGDSGGDASGVGGADGGGYKDGGQVKKPVRRVSETLKSINIEKPVSKNPQPAPARKTNPDTGIIRGQGTPTSDSVNIAASVDEYVLPAETVYGLGKNLLDELVAATHKPAGGGTHG